MVLNQKPIKLCLGCLAGENVFLVMGAFQMRARFEGWPQDDIDQVINECMQDDYDHVFKVLGEHCITPYGHVGADGPRNDRDNDLPDDIDPGLMNVLEKMFGVGIRVVNMEDIPRAKPVNDPNIN